jgi:tRNA(Ile)-lysidine synthase TilS/MesJ
MQQILGLVRRCVEDYGMIRAGERLAVGLSGGKDSLLTLTALAKLRAFSPTPFTLEAITVDAGTPGLDLSPLAEYCRSLDVPYTQVEAPIYEVVFEQRAEKNPCALCAKLRRGTLNTAARSRGIHKLALGHHYDDAAETLLMNLLFEGRIGCFQPVTYLDRMDVTVIRPLLYVTEAASRAAATRLHLPVVANPCPANGSTRRQEIKDLIPALEGRYPGLKKKLFGAMQRYPLVGWQPGAFGEPGTLPELGALREPGAFGQQE